MKEEIVLDAYIGEIRIFSGNYAPQNWVLCNGDRLSIQQYKELYGILGTEFGGDGVNNFCLPNLRGQAPMHFGSGAGLTMRKFGSQVGVQEVKLTAIEMPSHNHIAQASSVSAGGMSSPINAIWGTEAGFNATKPYKALDTKNQVQMNDIAIGFTGGSQPHNNMQPFLAMNFIMCVKGGENPSKP